MKKRLILTACLAFAMGLGVAVGAHQSNVSRASANSDVTVYCAIDPTTLGSYTLKLNANVGDNNTWLQSDMVLVNDTTSYPGKKIYKGTFEERYGGVDAMQFQLYDGANWHAQDQVISSWTTIGNYSGKIHVYGGAANSWAAYTEPAVVTHSVHVYVNGSERAGSPETVADGALPAEPAFEWGKSFSGWCSDADCKVPVAGITSDTTVYGKVETVPNVTYTIDDSRVNYGTLKLYAFEPGNHEKAAWPGEAIVNKTITVPEDATIIINNGDGKQTVNVAQSKVANDTLRILADVDGEGHNEVVWMSNVDEPASDGYYVVSSKNGHKYKDAPKMDPDTTGNNNAIYLGYSGLKDETIKVRMFEEERAAGKDVWSFFIENEYSEDFAEVDGDGNLLFLKNAVIDIYAKWEKVKDDPEEWELHFFAREHVNVYTVNVVIDGGTPAEQQVEEGGLPVPPVPAYGKSFDGWYSDALYQTKITAITSDTTVYGRIVNVPTVTYTIDDSRVEYDDLYLYAFEASGEENHEWPGVKLDGKSITVPDDATIIINNGKAEGFGNKQTVNITQSKVANDTLRILADLDEMNCNLVQWASDADEPASDGYYVVSSKNGHKYKDAPKMDVDPTGDNDAIYYGYSGLKDETIKVRMYEAARPEGADVWSFFVPNEYSEGIADIDESGNLVFLKDAEIDIYALWEPAPTMENPDAWALHFYISEHAVRHYISIYDVLFEGKRLASTAEVPHVARATEGVDFEYELPAMNGYFARKLYTNAECTVEYTPTKYSADGVLYAKYTRLGVYMTGDETYSGTGLAWDVDGAIYLSTIVNDPNNQLEGSVTIPASASTEHPVSVKALRYIGDEDKTKQWEGVTYKLGEEYSFCSLDKDSNLVFTKGGTFAIYINKEAIPEIYLNEGADAFYTKFLTDTGAVCREDNKTDTERLGEVWDELEGVYNSLSPDEKATIVAVGFNGGDEKGDDLHKVIARYHYIVWRYGSEAFKDFIFNTEEPIPPHPHGATIANEVFATASDNNIMIIVIASAVALSMAMVTLIIIKKKKFSK